MKSIYNNSVNNENKTTKPPIFIQEKKFTPLPAKKLKN